MSPWKTIATVAAAALMPMAGHAAVITLTFEGATNNAQLLNFYNGGTDSAGRSGTDHGVQFGPNALALVDLDAGGVGNFANEPSPDTGMYFLSGSAVLNYAAGFTDGFSFYYSSSRTGNVVVYDGVNLTGSVLGTIALTAQSTANACQGDPNGGPGDPRGQFCNWTRTGVAFTGTARSIDFSGTVNQVVFDNVTFGSAVPEPSQTAMFFAGLGALGLWARRRTSSAG